MKQFAWFAAACVLATLAALAGAPVATAYPEAGPEERLKLTVDRRVLYGGETFTATASANVTCGWTLAWNGERTVMTARVVRRTFTAPRVTRITKIPLHARCFYQQPGRRPTATARPDATPRSAGQVLAVRVPESWRKTIQITVLPAGSGALPPVDSGTGTGALPNTGGPPLWALFAGLGSLWLGWVAVRHTRRQRAPGAASGSTV